MDIINSMYIIHSMLIVLNKSKNVPHYMKQITLLHNARGDERSPPLLFFPRVIREFSDEKSD